MNAQSNNVAMFNALNKPTVPCGWCGVPTSSKHRVCKGCLGHERRASRRPGPEHALIGGAWVLNKGIQKWVAGAVPCGRALLTVGGSCDHQHKDTTNESTPEQRRCSAARGPRRPVKDTTDS